MAALGERRVDRTGNRKHVASCVGGNAGRDQRARAHRRFDHQHAACKPRDDAVATWEVVRDRRSAQRELGNHDAFGANPMRQRAIAGRIDRVDPGADHRDRAGVTVRIKCATMRSRVDAEREPADDGQSGPRQCSGEGFCVGDTLLRGVAATDDGQRRPAQQFGAPDGKQQRRRVRRGEQQRRILRIRK